MPVLASRNNTSVIYRQNRTPNARPQNILSVFFDLEKHTDVNLVESFSSKAEFIKDKLIIFLLLLLL